MEDTRTCIPRQLRRRALRSLSHHRGATDRLLAQRNAFYHGSRQDRFFCEAMLESFAFHFLHNRAFSELCQRENIVPGDLSAYQDLSRLPALPEQQEEESWLSVKPQQVKLELTSGSPTFLDARSLRRTRLLAQHIGRGVGLASREKCNYLFLNERAARSNEERLQEELIVSLSKRQRVRYVSPSQSARLPSVWLNLVNEGSSLRLIGSLSAWQLALPSLQAASSQAPAGANSLALVNADFPQACAFTATQQLISAALRLNPAQVRAFTWTPRQMLPLFTCACGRLHLPTYARAFQLAQETEPQVRFLSPHPAASAALSLTLPGTLTGEPCPCGLPTPYIIGK